MANLSPKSDDIPKNTQEGDNVIVKQIPPTKMKWVVKNNTAIKSQDSRLDKEFEVFKENGTNGRIEEPGTTINQCSESVRRASISLEYSIDEMQAVDALMNLQGRTIEEVIQDGNLDEKMTLLRTIYSGILEQEKEYGKIIANLTREIEMFKVNNSKLKSQILEAKATTATLKVKVKVLEEKIDSLGETLAKEKKKNVVSIIQYRIKWLEKECNLLDQQNRLDEEKKMNLRNELEAKKVEISFLLLELESEKAEPEELKALKEEESEMLKKLESCNGSVKRLSNDAVRIKREDAKKGERIESMARNQNEWIVSRSDRINNLRESFAEMQATICDKVNDLTESISNVIDKLAGNHCKVRIVRQKNLIDSPRDELVFIENSSSLNSTAEENLEESIALMPKYGVRTLLQMNDASEDRKLVVMLKVQPTEDFIAQ